MIFEQYYLECLSHASYLVGDETTGRAVVVDPQRDVDGYLADAAARGLHIERVIETHLHADFLSGHLELAEGWRKTNITWRPSLLDILPSAPFAGDDLTADDRRRLGLSAARAAFQIGENVHPSLAKAGFRTGDVVVGFNGVALDGTTGDLLG